MTQYKKLIRAIDGSGRMSLGMEDQTAPLIKDLIKKDRDYALFMGDKLIGYIQNKKLVTLE